LSVEDPALGSVDDNDFSMTGPVEDGFVVEMEEEDAD
jgi:hypothetical protein